MNNQDTDKVKAYEEWATEKVKLKPGLNLYRGLFVASRFLRPEGNGCDALEAGLAMYAYNNFFQKAYEEC